MRAYIIEYSSKDQKLKARAIATIDLNKVGWDSMSARKLPFIVEMFRIYMQSLLKDIKGKHKYWQKTVKVLVKSRQVIVVNLMIVKSLEIRNFRSFDEASSPLIFSDGINIIVGENNAGKSNILSLWNF